MQPYEVIAAPYTVYLAPQGTAFPTVDSNPSTISPWTTVGTAADRSYVDTGVTVTHSQTVGTFQGAGSTTIRKAWRQSEELVVAFSLADLSPAQYALVLNDATVSTTAASTAVPGDYHFEVRRGVFINAFAMLIQGVSPISEAYQAQYEISGCYDAGNEAPVYSPQGPAVLAVEFHAYEFVAGSLATWRAQSAPKS